MTVARLPSVVDFTVRNRVCSVQRQTLWMLVMWPFAEVARRPPAVSGPRQPFMAIEHCRASVDEDRHYCLAVATGRGLAPILGAC